MEYGGGKDVYRGIQLSIDVYLWLLYNSSYGLSSRLVYNLRAQSHNLVINSGGNWMTATITRADLAGKIQFTNVRPDATRSEIITHLERSMEYGFQAAMISMCWVPLAREVLRGSGVRIATCIGLGLGHESLHAKIALLRECRALGADEVDYEHVHRMSGRSSRSGASC